MEGRAAAIALAVILVLGLGWALRSGERGDGPPSAGSPAPDFGLPALGATGKGDLRLSSRRGRVVLLNFWATWCKPCEEEMPAMERVYRRLRPEGFELLAVSVDRDADEVARFRKRLGLDFPILLDPEQRVAGAYGTHRFPESYLIDRAGLVASRYVGPRPWDDPAYVERIRRLLAGSDGGGAP